MISTINYQPAVINKISFHAGTDMSKTALDYAIEKGNTDVINAIINSDADVNTGKTALNYAIEKGNLQMIQMLREASEKE